MRAQEYCSLPPCTFLLSPPCLLHLALQFRRQPVVQLLNEQIILVPCLFTYPSHISAGASSPRRARHTSLAVVFLALPRIVDARFRCAVSKGATHASVTVCLPPKRSLFRAWFAVVLLTETIFYVQAAIHYAYLLTPSSLFSSPRNDFKLCSFAVKNTLALPSESYATSTMLPEHVDHALLTRSPNSKNEKGRCYRRCTTYARCDWD